LCIRKSIIHIQKQADYSVQCEECHTLTIHQNKEYRKDLLNTYFNRNRLKEYSILLNHCASIAQKEIDHVKSNSTKKGNSNAKTISLMNSLSIFAILKTTNSIIHSGTTSFIEFEFLKDVQKKMSRSHCCKRLTYMNIEIQKVLKLNFLTPI